MSKYFKTLGEGRHGKKKDTYCQHMVLKKYNGKQQLLQTKS